MKRVTLVALFLAGTLAANAQSGPSFGAKVGVAAANIQESTGPDTNYLFGYQVGATANFGINDRFSFQPELLYSQKGYEMKGDNQGYKDTFRYLDLPLLVRLHAAGFFLEAGPQLGLLLGRKAEFSGGGTTTTVTNADGLRKLDVGYIAGLGYQLESGLGLGLRYNGGLTNVLERDVVDDFYVRNSVFQLQLSYLFSKP